jgi:hypothetical protein
MRLSQWRASAPAKEAAAPKVAAAVDPVLAALGAEADPHCWVAWGEEPAIRHTIFVPTDPGLIASFVRVNVPGEGPRATAKLIRWNRVSIGELGVETQAGHRLLSFQLESQVIRGVDAEADRAAAFALRVIAAIDGRPLPPVEAERGARANGGASAAGRATAGTPTAGARAAGASPAAARRGTSARATPAARGKAASDGGR